MNHERPGGAVTTCSALEPGFGHQWGHHDGQQDVADPGEQHRQPQVDLSECTGDEDADECQREVLLLEAGKEGLDGVGPDFIGDPGVNSSGDEGETEAPDDLCQHDRPERGEGALDEDPGPDDRGADESGEPA